MKYFLMTSSEPYRFLYAKSNDLPLETLGFFLMTEIIDQRLYNFFMNWLQNPRSDSGPCGNVYCLQKRGNNILIYSQSDSEDEKYYFICSNIELMDIINQWLKVYNSIPSEILITQEGNELKISRTDGIDCGNEPTLINQDELKTK